MICKRCGNEYTNPIPLITREEGVKEIATVEFCAECNALIMSLVYRDSTAYKIEKGVRTR